jgi:hypothetical protein
MAVAIMLRSEMILKYGTPKVAGALFTIGCLTAVTSIVVAQKAGEEPAVNYLCRHAGRFKLGDRER